jgi:hypothetical protein
MDSTQRRYKTTLGLILFEPFEFTQDGFDNFAAAKELFPPSRWRKVLIHFL